MDCGYSITTYVNAHAFGWRIPYQRYRTHWDFLHPRLNAIQCYIPDKSYSHIGKKELILEKKHVFICFYDPQDILTGR